MDDKIFTVTPSLRIGIGYLGKWLQEWLAQDPRFHLSLHGKYNSNWEKKMKLSSFITWTAFWDNLGWVKFECI